MGIHAARGPVAKQAIDWDREDPHMGRGARLAALLVSLVGVSCATTPDGDTLLARLTENPSAPWTTDLPPGVDVDDGLSATEAVSIAVWRDTGVQSRLAALGMTRAEWFGALWMADPVYLHLFPAGADLPRAREPFENFLTNRAARIPEGRDLAPLRAALRLTVRVFEIVHEVRLAYRLALIADERRGLYDELWPAQQRLALAQRALGLPEAQDVEGRGATVVSPSGVLYEQSLASARLAGLLGSTWRSPPQPLEDVLRTLPPVCWGALPETIVLASHAEIRLAELDVVEAARMAGWNRWSALNLLIAVDIEEGMIGAIAASLGGDAGLIRDEGNLAVLDTDATGLSPRERRLQDAIRRYRGTVRQVVSAVHVAREARDRAWIEADYWRDFTLRALAFRVRDTAANTSDPAGERAAAEAEVRLAAGRLAHLALDEAAIVTQARHDHAIGFIDDVCAPIPRPDAPFAFP
jgi:hypothetical protein